MPGINLVYDGAHMLDEHVLSHKEAVGKNVDVSRVARHENPSALAAAVSRPGRQRWIDVNDLHSSLGRTHNAVPVIRESTRQWASRRTDICDGAKVAREERGSAKPSENPRFGLQSKILLSPSGITSYWNDVTWGYRRALFSEGTAIIGPPSTR